MPMIELETKSYSSVENNRNRALEGLGIYLQTPEEKILREYQEDTIESYYNFLLKGQTAGYIILPGGAGKTIFAVELARATGLKTVFLSPSQPILEQTHLRFQQFAPNIQVSNYYTHEKQTSGQVLNTTYQSFINLLEEGKINPEEIEILICDEAHTALGELRHTIFRKIPHALMVGLTATAFFTQIEGFKRRGIVERDERWLELFEKCIYEMSQEEAIERGISPPVDIHLFRTHTTVENIGIIGGNYNSRQLERELSIEGRNDLVLAMIAGLDKMPSYIKIPQYKIDEIEEIHRKIRDKKTVVFGISVAQIKGLAQRLKDFGINAEAVWGNMPGGHKEILKKHLRGENQIVLSKDLISTGWDSPGTEVGIYMEPHFSATKTVQEFGRIMRISPETGKDKAIAIQLVDEFINPNEAPVLISDIFNPYFVLRGSQTGKEPSKKSEPKVQRKIRDIPKVYFFGMGINATLEETQSRFILQKRLSQATLKDISEAVDKITLDIQGKYGNTNILNFYRKVAEQIPFFTPTEKAEEAMQAIASLDSNTVALGKKVLIYLYLSTILNAIEPNLSDNDDENDELVQAAIEAALEGFSKYKKNYSIAQNIYLESRRGSEKYIAEKDGVPLHWVVNGWRKGVLSAIGQYSVELHGRLGENKITALAKEIAETTGESKELIYKYILFKNLKPGEEDLFDTDLFEEVLQDFLEDDLDENMRRELTPREKLVLEMTHGILGNQEYNLREVGEELDISRERARQIMGEAMRKLRTAPGFREKIVPYLYDLPLSRLIHISPERREEVLQPEPKEPYEFGWMEEDRMLILKHFGQRELRRGDSLPWNRGLIYESPFSESLHAGDKNILSNVGTVANLLSLSESMLNELFSVDEWIGNKKFNLGLTIRDHQNFQRFLQKLLEEAKKLENLT